MHPSQKRAENAIARVFAASETVLAVVSVPLLSIEKDHRRCVLKILFIIEEEYAEYLLSARKI
jgi:hypothetical protein